MTRIPDMAVYAIENTKTGRLAEVLGVPYADLIEDVTDPVEAEETA